MRRWRPNSLSGQFSNACKIVQFSPEMAPALAFWREGKVALDSYRNIQAFFNFYFVLEGLYGGGQYRRDKILPKFLASPRLIEGVKATIGRGFDKPFRGDHASVESVLKAHNRTVCPRDLLDLLVIYRGRLHHWLKADSVAGTPLTENEYEAIARLAFRISSDALTLELNTRIAENERRS